MADKSDSKSSSRKSRPYVRDATPDDREQIIEHFYRIWGPETGREKEKTFDWLFMKNPHITGDISRILLLIANEKIIGVILSTPVDIIIKGTEQRIVWWGSTSIDEEYRGRASSLRFTKRMSEIKVYGIGYPIERVIPIYKKFSRSDNPLYVIDKFGFAVKPLRVDKLIPAAFLRSPANMIYGILDRGLVATKTDSSIKRITVTKVTRFTETFDEWFDTVRDGYRDLIIMKLNHKYLNWRYMDAPIRKYSVFSLNSEGRFRGFYVLEEYETFGTPTCAITDFFADREDHDAFDRIMTHAIGEARQRGAVLLKVMESYVPQFRNLYKKFGFLPGKGSRHPMIIYLPPTYPPETVDKPEFYFFGSGFSDPKII